MTKGFPDIDLREEEEVAPPLVYELVPTITVSILLTSPVNPIFLLRMED